MTRSTTPLLAAVTLAVLAAALPVTAQQATPPPVPSPTAPAPSTPARIATLDKALEKASWDPALRGPLLVVSPQNTRLSRPKALPGELYPDPPPQSLPPPAYDGYRLNTLAPYFGRKLVRLGSLSVLAPTQMVVFNTRPGKPDLFTGLRRPEKIRLLQAALSPAQWRLLGAPQGLGLSDLTGEQKTLFLSLLPEPFTLHKLVQENVGRGTFDNKKGSQVTLSAAQRAALRLRLNRSVSLNLARGVEQDIVYGVIPHPVGTDFFTVVSGHESSRQSNAYGVTLRQEVPNRLKLGHIDFTAPALAMAVPLADAKTVGEMVKRVAQAARVELYADGRMAKLPLWTLGESARAGDVLKALCYALTGAFRKVGPAFVLTDDVAGWGARRQLLAEWGQDAQAQEQAQREALDKRIQEQQPLQYLSYSPDQPLPPSEVIQKIEKGWDTRRGRYGSEEVPVSSLPPAQQELVSQTVAGLNERLSGNKTVTGDRVGVSVRFSLSYLVPGIGAVDSGHTVSPTTLMPPLPPLAPSSNLPVPSTAPVVLPPALAQRALYVAPTNGDEAALAAQEAQRRGLTQLWVEVGEEESAVELLASAIQAGKEAKLPVFAVVRLLQRRPRAAQGTAGEHLDLNILGETGAAWGARRAASMTTQGTGIPREFFARAGDWLRPDVSVVATALKQWLQKIAALPGLAGLVLSDTGAPGYTAPDGGNHFFAGTDFGYTLEARLAFLRQEGYDPIDFVGSSNRVSGVELELPFFEDVGPRLIQVDGQYREDKSFVSPGQRWNAFRYQKNAPLLVDLYTAVRAVQPNLPLLMRNRTMPGFDPGGWYGSWDKADVLPRQTFGSGGSALLSARSQAKRVFLNISYFTIEPGMMPASSGFAMDFKPGTPEAFAFLLSLFLGFEKMEQTNGTSKAWDGIVLDMSQVSVKKAIHLLDALAPPPGKAASRRGQ